MQQAELHMLVDGLKADFSKTNEVDRKTVADRSNMANLGALDMLAETVLEKNIASFTDKATALRGLSDELGEITDFVETLGKRSKSF